MDLNIYEGLMFLFVINMVVIFVVGGIDAYTKFVLRSSITSDLIIKLQRLKYNKIWSELDSSIDAWITWYLYDLIGGAVIIGVLCGLEEDFLNLIYIGVTFLTIASPFIIRFIIDIIKSLRFNIKTGEAERIIELEKAVERLIILEEEK